MSEHISAKSSLEKEKGGSPEGTGFGALLRNEREKQGFDYSRISETTKLRPIILEAIENEDWDKLPSPVFVMGFVRSYARALGIDEDTVLALYQSSCPVEATPLKPVSRPAKSRKTLPIILFFLALAMLLGYYSFKEHRGPEKSVSTSKTIEPANEVGEDITKKEEKAPEAEDKPELLPRDQLNDENEAMKADNQITESNKTNISAEKKEKRLSPLEEMSVPQLKSVPEVEVPMLTLMANVTSDTWLKISVDNQAPREYNFLPGNQPTWKASHGFDLTIGNAGGIRFELNGKTIKNLGNPGQVIRLRLPKGYRGIISEQ